MESPSQDAPSEPQVNAVKSNEVRFAIRGGRAEDVAYIVDSWVRSYQYDQRTSCPGGLGEYFETQKQVIATCLQTSQVLVAYPTAPAEVADENHVLGWACFRPSVIHYVFVRPTGGLRGQGIATALLEQWRALSPGRLFTSHSLLRPADERGAGLRGLVAKGRRFGVAMEYNPALIFGRKP